MPFILQAGSLMPGSPVCLAVSGSEERDQTEHNYSSDQGIQVREKRQYMRSLRQYRHKLILYSLLKKVNDFPVPCRDVTNQTFASLFYSAVI